MVLYLNIVQIIVSLALIALVILQARKAGLGRMFGGDYGVHQTRRGVDKTVFNATVVLAVVFFLTSLLSVIVQS